MPTCLEVVGYSNPGNLIPELVHSTITVEVASGEKLKQRRCVFLDGIKINTVNGGHCIVMGSIVSVTSSVLLSLKMKIKGSNLICTLQLQVGKICIW